MIMFYIEHLQYVEVKGQLMHLQYYVILCVGYGYQDHRGQRSVENISTLSSNGVL